MQRFLNIDKHALQEVEKILILSPEYDLRGWIKEAIEELIEAEKSISESDLNQFKCSYNRIGFSFKSEFWKKFDETVKRLKNLKKFVSRNVLVNQAIFRKINSSRIDLSSEPKPRSFYYQEELPIKGSKIKVDLRLPRQVLEEVKKQVEFKRKKNVRYSISDWLNEAVRNFLHTQEKGKVIHISFENISPKDKKRTAVYLNLELLKQIDFAVSVEKRRKKGFSRSCWLQKSTMEYLSQGLN